MNGRVRLTFCIDNMQVGGTELNAVRTAEILDRDRYDIEVVCLQSDGPLVERYRDAGIPVLAFPTGGLAGPGFARQGARLRGHLRRRRTDILHAHDTYSNVFGTFWGRVARVPALLASRRWWLHEPRRGMRTANRLGCRMAHAVLANAPRVARLVVEEEGVEESRVFVVPNFLDESAFRAPEPETRAAFLRDFGLPPGGTAIGMVANLSPVKDHDGLLRAFAQLAPAHPGAHLVLVGDGECRAALEGLAHELDLADRIHFAGRLTGSNWHHMFDLSVHGSASEAFSNAVIEAMAAGNAIVATDVGATADAIDDGETGILVPAGQPEALAEGLDTLLRDESRRRAMAAAGRQRARRRFTPEVAIRALERLYDSLLRGRPHLVATSPAATGS